MKRNLGVWTVYLTLATHINTALSRRRRRRLLPESIAVERCTFPFVASHSASHKHILIHARAQHIHVLRSTEFGHKNVLSIVLERLRNDKRRCLM